jgi:hypothetical protein
MISAKLPRDALESGLRNLPRSRRSLPSRQSAFSSRAVPISAFWPGTTAARPLIASAESRPVRASSTESTWTAPQSWNPRKQIINDCLYIFPSV